MIKSIIGAHLLDGICSFSKWGRNGFDGDKEALVAYRVPPSRKKAEINIIADDYNYALAA